MRKKNLARQSDIYKWDREKRKWASIQERPGSPPLSEELGIRILEYHLDGTWKFISKTNKPLYPLEWHQKPDRGFSPLIEGSIYWNYEKISLEHSPGFDVEDPDVRGTTRITKDKEGDYLIAAMPGKMQFVVDKEKVIFVDKKGKHAHKYFDVKQNLDKFIEKLIKQGYKDMKVENQKHNAVPVVKQVPDEELAQKLFDYLLSTGGSHANPLYTNWFQPLAELYDKKRKKKIYDEELTFKGFRNLAAAIFDQYKRKVLKNPKARISFATKQATAKLLLTHYYEEYGNEAKKKPSKKTNPSKLYSLEDVEKRVNVTLKLVGNKLIHQEDITWRSVIEKYWINAKEEKDLQTHQEKLAFLSDTLDNAVYAMQLEEKYKARGKKANKANPTRLTIEKCASVADVERFFKETCGFKFDEYGINPHTYSVNDQDDIIEIHVVDNIDAPTLAKLQGYLTTMISYTVYQLIVQKDFQKFAVQRPKMSIKGEKPKTSTYQVIYDKANPSKEILKKINALRYMTGEEMIEGGTGDLFNELFDSSFGNESESVNWNRYLTLFPEQPEAKTHLKSLMKLKPQSFIHFVDDMIRYVKLDMSEGNVRSKKNMQIDVKNTATVNGVPPVFIQPAIKKAVVLLKQGKRSYVEERIKRGDYPSDPHWTGD